MLGGTLAQRWRTFYQERFKVKNVQTEVLGGTLAQRWRTLHHNRSKVKNAYSGAGWHAGPVRGQNPTQSRYGHSEKINHKLRFCSRHFGFLLLF